MAALSPMGAFFLFLIMFIGTCFLLKVNVAFGVGIGCVTLLIFGHYANTPFLQASFSAMDSFPFLFGMRMVYGFCLGLALEKHLYQHLHHLSAYGF